LSSGAYSAWREIVFLEICTLLGYNAASSGNPLPTFRHNVSVPTSRVKKCKKWTSWPLKSKKWTCWPLQMGPIRCPETSVKDYHSTLRYTPEERRSQLMCLLTNSCFVCRNTYSSHAHRLVKNILRFWNVNIRLSCTNIGRKMLYWEIHTFYEVWILKTKELSTGKTLTGKTFCGVCLYLRNRFF
jgi:hypothetical protein